MAPSKTSSPPSSLTTAASCFLSQHQLYIRLLVSSPYYSDADPHRLLPFLRDTVLPSLCKRLQFAIPDSTYTIFPALFTLCASDAATSLSLRQDRGWFLIGVNNASPSSSSSSSALRAHIDTDAFISRVLSSAQVGDMPSPPYFEVGVSTQEELDKSIVPDFTMWVPSYEDGEENEWLYSHDMENDTPAPASQEHNAEPSTEKEKLKPIHDILHRLQWDPSYTSADYVVTYLDRFTGFVDVPLSKWRSDSSAVDFVPLHRVTSVRRQSSGQTVWWREGRVDLISGSGGK